MISIVRCKAAGLSFIGMVLTLVVFTWASERPGRGSFNADEKIAAGLYEAPQSPRKEWNKIPGGAGTSCSSGSPYFFFVRPGDPQRLLIHFQGGGACWNSVNCNLQRTPTFDPVVDDTDQPKPAGIFDIANPQNPFKDFTMVFVSYCTGDVHLGNRIVTYPAESPDSRPDLSFQIRHEGYRNAVAAIRWSFTNLPSPEVIFISGESAGAIATPFFATIVGARYNRSRVVQLGDSGGGYRSPTVTKLLEGWGAIETIRSVKPYNNHKGAINFETLYTSASRKSPSVRFAQFNPVEDSVQLRFLRLIGVEGIPLERLLEQNYSDIRNARTDFRTFTAPGKTHTILSRPEFYLLEVDGVRFSDWVKDLVMGKQVKDVKVASSN